LKALDVQSAQKKGLQLLGTLFIYCEFLVGRAGLEPATNGLKVRRIDELSGLIDDHEILYNPYFIRVFLFYL